ATPDRDSGRGTRTAGRRLPNAPLVNTQTHPIGPDDLEEPDVNAPREIRMSRELGSQYTDVRGVDRIDEQNGVRIAHRYGADLDVAARGAQRVPVALGGRAKRQRFGREIRHAEIDADDTFAAHARIDRARRAREPQLAVGQMSSGGDEARNAARTVAALLDLAAVRVEDPVSGVARAVVGERDEQKLVEADAEAAVRETPHDVRFRSGSLPRPIDDHEVVAETVHFREADLHACRVRGW